MPRDLVSTLCGIFFKSLKQLEGGKHNMCTPMLASYPAIHIFWIYIFSNLSPLDPKIYPKRAKHCKIKRSYEKDYMFRDNSYPRDVYCLLSTVSCLLSTFYFLIIYYSTSVPDSADMFVLACLVKLWVSDPLNGGNMSMACLSGNGHGIESLQNLKHV